MRILIIANLFGNNRQGYDLAAVLRKRGFQVRLVQYAPKSDPVQGDYGVHYFRPHGLLSKFHVLLNLFSILRKSFFFKCETVVCIGASLLPVAAGLKIWNAAHLIYYSLEYCKYGRCLRTIVRRTVDGVIDVEENRRAQFFKDVSINKPFLILYNMSYPSSRGIVRGKLRSYLKTRFSFKGDETIIAYAGSYQDYACLGNIIEASKRFPDGQVLVLMVSRGLPKSMDVNCPKCFVVPAQEGDEFFDWLSDVDCALLPYESKTDFNVINCSPQKLFDCYRVGVPYLATRRALIVEVNAEYPAAGGFCDFGDIQSIVDSCKTYRNYKTNELSAEMMNLYRTKYNYSQYEDKIVRFMKGIG